MATATISKNTVNNTANNTVNTAATRVITLPTGQSVTEYTPKSVAEDVPARAKCRVRGVTFGKRQRYLRNLMKLNAKGAWIKVFLEAEPNNPADPNAVRVKAVYTAPKSANNAENTAGGKPEYHFVTLGYLPREYAARIQDLEALVVTNWSINDYFDYQRSTNTYSMRLRIVNKNLDGMN